MRHFEFADSSSYKLWEVEQEGSDLDLRWGKIGAQGRSQTKSFADDAKCTVAMDKLIADTPAPAEAAGWFGGEPADPTVIHKIRRCGLGGAQWRSLSPLLVSEMQRNLHQMNLTQ